MKILKIFGWTLLSVFVFFLVLLIGLAVFDYLTDDMEVMRVERTDVNLSESSIQLFCAYMNGDEQAQGLDQLLSEAADSDIILMQNAPEEYEKRLESLFPQHNLYFSFTKRAPISFSSHGQVELLTFSGLYTLSTFSPKEVRKLLLPTDINWFNSLLSPSPSVQILEFAAGNTPLFIINMDQKTNRQFESGGMNTSRLDYLKSSILETLPKDARVIIVGSWQNRLPGQLTANPSLDEPFIPLDWTKAGWQWIYSPDSLTGYGALVSHNIQVKAITSVGTSTTWSSPPLKLQLAIR
ncbi:MAG TPA: hypothetical protein P5107_04950 [Thermotogota bacterium]|nr:hypothetical protein [Thermotogota bacterium]HRW34383.1 hypothetical protein [Thermotogota bacterium]